MIYIDPPYNTKNENFIYPDNFREDYKKILIETGLLSFDEEGEEIPSEILKFFRNITGTRSHSGYLSFMLPRLKLARDLLREDGVIFISIDDNEQANLKLLCDEIFGEENFIETFLWNKTSTPPSASNKTRKTHEYILCYQKNKDKQKMISRFSNDGDAPLWNEPNSLRDLLFPSNYVFTNLENGIYRKGIRDKIELLDDVEVKNGKILNPFRLRGHFRWKQETLEEEIRDNVFLIVKSDKFSIRYCREGDRIVMPTNEISKKDGVGTNETASSELKRLFDDIKLFDFNKPVNLVKYLIKIISSTNPNDIILDFFAGSGTTAQAVMELNAEDGENREFILVQIDQEIDKDKNKTAYDFCKNELGSQNPVISDITIERVNRAGEKIKNTLKEDLIKTNQNLDIGYKVYTLSDKPSIISDESGGLKLISSRDRLSSLDIARNLALSSGKVLSLPLMEIIKDKLYFCEDCYYLLSIDDEVRSELETKKDFEIYIDGYSDIDLENLLNLGIANQDQINVIY